MATFPEHHDTVVKLEPSVFQETDFQKHNSLCRDYKETLRHLAAVDRPKGVHLPSEPSAIFYALDKVHTQQKLVGAGLKTTPLLSVTLCTFDELAELLYRQKRGGFLKPRHDSGAKGAIAIRYNHRRDEWVAYTTMRQTGDYAYNGKHVYWLTNRKEIAVPVEEVMRYGAVLGEQMVKEKLEGENYDLRAICREDKADYVVVRRSKDAITNFHLDNKTGLFGELSLTPSVREELFYRSITATRALGPRYIGIDMLVTRNMDTPYIIEMNGQGDHIYQDIFTEDKVYISQMRTIELFFSGSR